MYESWLKIYHQEHPEINRYTIAFDNQKTVITYNDPLPGIDTLVSEIIYVTLFLEFFELHIFVGNQREDNGTKSG